MSNSGKSAIRTPAVFAPSADMEERLRAFAEIGSDWFWEKDAALRFTYMSQGIDGPASSFAADFLGRRIDEVDVPGFAEVDWRPLLKVLARRAPFRDFRFIRRTPHGIRHLCVSGMPVFDGMGTFVGYRGTGRDLTKETLAEERAATAPSRLAGAIESIPESFALFDRDDRLVLCNSRHREIHAAVAHLLVPGTPFAEICRAIADAEQPAGARGREEEWVEERLRRHAAAHESAVERAPLATAPPR
jgi:PAS domain-containing protein